MRFVGRRDGPRRRARCGAWTGPRSTTAGERAHHAVRGLQLRRQGGDRGRGANLHRGDRGGVPAPPLRTRHARSRPPDPHERRAAHLELPAVAAAPTRSSSSATSSGPTSRARRSRRRSTSTRRAGAASGGASAWRPRRERARAGQLGPRRRASSSRSRRSSSRSVIVGQGGEVFALGLFVLGVVALGELYTLMGRVRPPALAGFLTLGGAAGRGALRRAAPRDHGAGGRRSR